MLKKIPTNTQNVHRAKKSLGQNFLKSIPALNKIIETGEITKDDIILEIGPGKGALTAKLLEHAGLVVAVEMDRDLLVTLREKFSVEIKSRQLLLIEGDVLEFDLDQEVSKFLSGPRLMHEYVSPDHAKNLKPLSPTTKQTSLPHKYKVIANIPYNITGAILKKFLTADIQPQLMVLMVQHEVAKRIMDPKGSLLSISVKAYGTPKLIMKVSARYFSPAPKVDSAIISIKNISRQLFVQSSTLHSVSEERFWQVLRAGFAHKRKKLSSNLRELGNLISKEKLEQLSAQNRRAEDMNLEDWMNLIKNS